MGEKWDQELFGTEAAPAEPLKREPLSFQQEVKPAKKLVPEKPVEKPPENLAEKPLEKIIEQLAEKVVEKLPEAKKPPPASTRRLGEAGETHDAKSAAVEIQRQIAELGAKHAADPGGGHLEKIKELQDKAKKLEIHENAL